MCETCVRDGVCQLALPGGRWLVTGPAGGFREADAAYNVTVPDGFDRTDPAAYAASRRRDAGFDHPGPGLLTGVDVTEARGARAGPVTVVATVGLSNPTAIDEIPTKEENVGTVNLLVGTSRALADGALATLLSTVVEAKTGTLQAATGFTGTTSDAVVVGTDPSGEQAAFAGSATGVGAAARVCVRTAIEDALESVNPPATVAEARHGSVPAVDPERFAPAER